MRAKIQAFWLPKAGNSLSEFEDAFWPKRAIQCDSDSFRLAIGDGATETSFSALWARMLVHAYGTKRLPAKTMVDSLPRLQKLWHRFVSKKKLPWYAEEKFRSGAYSSLLGITILESSEWEGLAVGDSCLFQIRNEKLIKRWPLDRTEQFSSRPVLVPSVKARNESLADAVKVESGRWENGDVFYLMTDALACWFLREFELSDGHSQHFLDLEKIQEESAFRDLVESQRAKLTSDGTRLLRNDDVTFVRVSVTSAA